MRKACWIWFVAVSLGSAAPVRADDKPTAPAGAIPIDDIKKQTAKPQVMKQPSTHMSRSRLGVGDFFRRLFGPGEPKINGNVIGGAQTYKSGIMPVAPIVPK